jgi:glycerol-3-phosphate acyltransferase PlsY
VEEARILSYLLVGLGAYLLGGIPTGLLVARRYRSVDLLKHGSGRTGTTNVLRTLGWKAAGAVFLGDFAKGVAAIGVARMIAPGDPMADLIAGLGALVGHNYSPYIGFKGGRGVAAGLGTLLVVAPVALLVVAVVGVSVIALTRYVSLGSILGSCAAPLVLLVLVLTLGQPQPHLAYALAGALFVVASHRDNIGRLLRGTERKLGERARA